MRIFTFEEPHKTGGNSTVTINEEQIIKFMREKILPLSNRYPADVTDDDLLRDFIVVHWCTEKN